MNRAIAKHLHDHDVLRPVFEDLAAFYGHRPGSSESGERDYGMHWVIDAHMPNPRWRVTLIEDTADVIAVRLSYPAATVWLATNVTREDVDRALAGWESRSYPTLRWAERQFADADPSKRYPAPVFESSVSPLTTSNDGRVRMRMTNDQDSSRTKVISIDGLEVWRSHNQTVVDAFIAGWDAHEERSR